MVLLACLLSFTSAALLVLWLGSREVIRGRISLGEFVAFNAYLVMLSWPMIAFGWVTNILQRGMASWKRMLEVGLPAGAEFALMFIYMGVIYWVISDFGAAAQAGFGIGSRVMQSIFLPAMAIAFAAGPIAGQNFGAKMGSRVRETFFKAAGLSTVVMIGVTAFLQWRPEVLVAFFTPEAEAQAVGATFLRIISWTFIAQGVVFTCSGIFQGLGNTIPAMLSSAIRLCVFVPLAVWVSSRPAFHLDEVWWLSVSTVWLQAAVSYVLLRHQFKRRLVDRPAAAVPPAAAPAPAES